MNPRKIYDKLFTINSKFDNFIDGIAESEPQPFYFNGALLTFVPSVNSAGRDLMSYFMYLCNRRMEQYFPNPRSLILSLRTSCDPDLDQFEPWESQFLSDSCGASFGLLDFTYLAEPMPDTVSVRLQLLVPSTELLPWQEEDESNDDASQ